MTQAPPTRPDVATIEMTAEAKERDPGAKKRPKALVKITNEDRRGFVSESTSNRKEGFFFDLIHTSLLQFRAVCTFSKFGLGLLLQ
jgi:hypothetical protein